MSCDSSHIPLHHQNKILKKEKSKEKNIKLRKIDKRKEKC